MSRTARKLLADFLNSFGISDNIPSKPQDLFLKLFNGVDGQALDPMVLKSLSGYFDSYFGLTPSPCNGTILSSEFPVLGVDPNRWKAIRTALIDGKINLSEAQAQLRKLTREAVERNLHSPEPKSSEDNPYSIENPNRKSFLEWLERVRLKPRLMRE